MRMLRARILIAPMYRHDSVWIVPVPKSLRQCKWSILFLWVEAATPSVVSTMSCNCFSIVDSFILVDTNYSFNASIAESILNTAILFSFAASTSSSKNFKLLTLSCDSNIYFDLFCNSFTDSIIGVSYSFTTCNTVFSCNSVKISLRLTRIQNGIIKTDFTGKFPRELFTINKWPFHRNVTITFIISILHRLYKPFHRSYSLRSRL